jgi:cation:H+ antiporter
LVEIIPAIWYKVNSILWIRQGKDAMAMGNVTGAMAFQGSVLPAIGIFLTPWTLNLTVTASSIITLLAGFWMYLLVLRKIKMTPAKLIINGILYLTFVTIVLANI